MMALVLPSTLSGLFPTTVISSLIDSPRMAATLPPEITAGDMETFPIVGRPASVPNSVSTSVQIYIPTSSSSVLFSAMKTDQRTAISESTKKVVESPTIIRSSPSPSTVSESRGLSRSIKLGLGVGISLGVLALVGILVLVCNYGKRTGIRSVPGRSMESLRRMSRASWFRRSGFRKAELCAESQQIVEIGSNGGENVAGRRCGCGARRGRGRKYGRERG